jgi:hypothetical protein
LSIDAQLWTRPPGRMVVIFVWAFVGELVLARNTLHG